jgi:hypothetical protein
MNYQLLCGTLNKEELICSENYSLEEKYKGVRIIVQAELVDDSLYYLKKLPSDSHTLKQALKEMELFFQSKELKEFVNASGDDDSMKTAQKLIENPAVDNIGKMISFTHNLSAHSVDVFEIGENIFFNWKSHKFIQINTDSNFLYLPFPDVFPTIESFGE